MLRVRRGHPWVAVEEPGVKSAAGPGGSFKKAAGEAADFQAQTIPRCFVAGFFDSLLERGLEKVADQLQPGLLAPFRVELSREYLPS